MCLCRCTRVHTQRTPIATSVPVGVHTHTYTAGNSHIHPCTHALVSTPHPIPIYLSPFTHTHIHTQHTRLRTDDRRPGKNCSLQPCSYLKRSIAGKGTKAKPAINSRLPPRFSCPPAFMALPLLSRLPASGRAARAGLSPGASSRALEARWPSTDHWDRPGTPGLGGCRGTGPATGSHLGRRQACAQLRGREAHLGRGCCFSRTAKAGSFGGGERWVRQAAATPSGALASQSGQPFPGLAPGLAPGPPDGSRILGAYQETMGWRTSEGEGASPTLSSSSLTY